MKVANRCGLSDNAGYPCCVESVETWMHVLQSSESCRRVYCKEQLLVVRKQLYQAKTHPVMANRIMTTLHQLMGGHEVTIPKSTNQNNNILERAFREQKKLDLKIC